MRDTKTKTTSDEYRKFLDFMTLFSL